MKLLHQINEDVIMENTDNDHNGPGNDGKNSLINKRNMMKKRTVTSDQLNIMQSSNRSKLNSN